MDFTKETITHSYLAVMARTSEMIDALDAGKIATKDIAKTRAQFFEHNLMLLKLIEETM